MGPPTPAPEPPQAAQAQVPHLDFSPLTLLLAQIAAILLVSRLLGLATRRMGQPLVIAEVVAGICLGPSLLGWVWPEGMEALFPAKSMDALKMLSQVGLVLFMFLVGLEFDPRLVKGRTHTSVARASLPGQTVLTAQYTSCRAFHRRRRSSSVSAQSKRNAPSPSAMALNCSTWSRAPTSVP